MFNACDSHILLHSVKTTNKINIWYMH